MKHLQTAFGGADTYSAAQRYSFDAQGNVTGQTAITGMGAELSQDLGQTADATFDAGMHLG